MQLDIFNQEKQLYTVEQQIEYFYLIRFQKKNINAKTLEFINGSKIITMHAIYTTIEEVNSTIDFLKNFYSYAGWYHIIRTKKKPNLNKGTWIDFIN